MKKIAMVIILISFVTTANAEEWTTNMNVLAVSKTLSKDDWEPIDKQKGIGFMFDFGKKDWPANIAIDIISTFSDKESVGIYEVTSRSTEFDIGVRKYFNENKNFMPYVGGGVCSIEHTAEIAGISADASGTGVWGSVGFLTVLKGRNAEINSNRGMTVGLEVRVSKADGEFEDSVTDQELELGGTMIAFFVGYHW